MTPRPAIRAVGLAKRYRIGRRQESYRTLRETLGRAVAAPVRRLHLLAGHSSWRRVDREASIWALKDVSFEVGHGEVVGIIGRNGAGKTTLLKVLSRIARPTEGYALLEGRVGCLLEVGTGFHGELTGRENVYLSGAILGMKHAEVTRKFDEIVEFAGVDQFMDTPVKHYSTGMHLRLAFAVAAHLEPDILMVDEALAVGDAAFQRKCLGKMQQVSASGRTVVFVSHDMTAMVRLAPRAMLLDQGRIRFSGPTAEAVRLHVAQPPQAADLGSRHDRAGDGVVRIEGFAVCDAEGRAVSSVRCGDAVTMLVRYRSARAGIHPDDVWVHVRLTDVLGHPVTTFANRYRPAPATGPLGPTGVFACHVPALLLADDTYLIDIWIDYRAVLSDFVVRASELQIVPSDYFGTGQALSRSWNGPAIMAYGWSVDGDRGPLTPYDLASAGEDSSAPASLRPR